MQNGGTLTHTYELSDHLGNVRAVVQKKNNTADVTHSTDYYPYGWRMPDRVSIGGNRYRFGYQGQFAEYDPETGYNHFEARLLDTRIGRWLTTDPAGQFFSPYVSMGNNPVNLIDPDGEWVKGAGFFRNIWHSDQWNTARLNVINSGGTWMKQDGVWQGVWTSGDYFGFDDQGIASGNYGLSIVEFDFISKGVGQPGFGEGLIPVWGSGRSAIDHFQNGKYASGVGQTALAITDVALLKAAATAVAKASIKTAATKTGAQFTKSSLSRGQQVHKAYKANLHNPAKGLYKEFTGIKGIRPDFVDFNKRIIYELKPNNPRQIKLGRNQLNRYKAAFEVHYGGTWKTVLDLY